MRKRHWFWTGNGKAQTAIRDWQGRLLDPFQDMKAKQFASANKVAVDEARKQLEVEGGKFAEGHAHRFERVSILLGHTSVKYAGGTLGALGAGASGAG